MGLFDGTSLQQAVTCDRCGKPLAECDCPRDAGGELKLPKDQPARVLREKRRGKWTTVVAGLDPAASDLAAMLKSFQTALGVGGTVRADGFELQGDSRDKLVAALKAKGYPAKPAGG